MYPNGVSHVTVHDDLEGTYVMLKWLSYMPKCKGAKLPIVACWQDVRVRICLGSGKMASLTAAPSWRPRSCLRRARCGFPDSAYKTAQAINDFNREELPLFVFANWRGFSGGMKDMYDQVLKFGAYIVDALHTYRQACDSVHPSVWRAPGVALGLWWTPPSIPAKWRCTPTPTVGVACLNPRERLKSVFVRRTSSRPCIRVDARCREILSLLGTAEP
ncbi:hypothetical protein MRX96_041086 [Rhipicephalus microplus]